MHIFHAECLHLEINYYTGQKIMSTTVISDGLKASKYRRVLPFCTTIVLGAHWNHPVVLSYNTALARTDKYRSQRYSPVRYNIVFTYKSFSIIKVEYEFYARVDPTCYADDIIV